MQQRGLTRVLMQLCCIFLLLFAQQSALTHALWHAAAAGDSHAAHASDSGDDAHEHHSDVQGALCDYHAAFGTMLGGHHGAVLALAVAADGLVEAPLSPAGRITTEAVPAVSRGPPILL